MASHILRLYPALLAFTALWAGVAAAPVLGWHRPGVAAWAALPMLGAVWMAIRATAPGVRAVAVATAFAAAGVVWLNTGVRLPTSADFAPAEALPGRVWLSGTVASPPILTAQGMGVVLARTVATRHQDDERETPLGRIVLYAPAGPRGPPGIGTHITARAHLSILVPGPGGDPYGSAVSWYARGVYARAAGEITARKPGNPPVWDAFRNAVHAWRWRALERLRATGNPDQEWVAAMVLGDQSRIATADRTAFAASGTTHILSVSGMHFAVVALAIFGLTRYAAGLLWPWGMASGWAARLAALAATLPIFLYLLVSGGQDPAWRAFVMTGCLIGSRLVPRQSAPLNALGVAGLMLVAMDAAAPLRLGFQLSFVCVAAILACASWIMGQGHDPAADPLRPPSRWEPVFRGLAASVRTAVVCSLATAPLLAAVLGSFPAVGALANVLVAPLAGFAIMPAGALAIAIGLLDGPAAWLGGMISWVADFVRAVNHIFGSLPGANFHGSPGQAVVLAAGAVFIVTRASWRPLRKGLAGAAVVWAGIGLPPVLAGAPLVAGLRATGLEVRFLDTGQGDAVLVRIPGGPSMLIDAGPPGYWSKNGTYHPAALATYFPPGAAPPEIVVLTHAHPDHFGGLTALPAPPAEIWYAVPPGTGANPDWAGGLRRATAAGTRLRRIARGDEFGFGGTILRVLHPGLSWHQCSQSGSDVNNGSVVLALEHQGRRFLFTGDIERGAEAALAATVPRADVLKVAHHGSSTSTNSWFIGAVRPALAIAQAGAGNRYGFPHPRVICELVAGGAQLLTTARCGTITVRVLDGRVTWEAANRTPACLAGYPPQTPVHGTGGTHRVLACERSGLPLTGPDEKT